MRNFLIALVVLVIVAAAFFAWFFFFRNQDKKATIQDAQVMEREIEKTGLARLNPFDKGIEKTSYKEVDLGTTLILELPFKVDYQALSLAFLVNKYSTLDKDFFANEGGTKSSEELEYLGIFSRQGDANVVGASDEGARTITFRMFDLQGRQIAGNSFNDLGVIFGNSGDETNEFFTSYRGSFPVDGSIIVNELTLENLPEDLENQNFGSSFSDTFSSSDNSPSLDDYLNFEQEEDVYLDENEELNEDDLQGINEFLDEAIQEQEEPPLQEDENIEDNQSEDIPEEAIQE